MHHIAETTIGEYRKFQNGKWLSALWINRRDLRKWIQEYPTPIEVAKAVR
jgi:hypothetical protein